MTTTEILMSPLDSLPDSILIRLIRKISIIKIGISDERTMSKLEFCTNFVTLC